jgi:hypothetical protein
MPSHALPYHAAATMLPCHDLAPMPCPYHAMTPPHALPLPFHATAAICCHPCPPMPCPLPLPCPTTCPAPKFRKPTRWWEHSGGGTIEGIMWEHNVDTLWGYNGEAQCGGTMWRHNVGTMYGHNVGAQCRQQQHNVGAQCGHNGRGTMWEHINGRGIINLWGHNQFVGARHAVPPQPSYAIPCYHPMPSHAIPCYHPMP